MIPLHTYHTITLEHEAHVGLLILNRPQQRNAMDTAMAAEFRDAMDRIKQLTDIKVLVVTGAGSAFTAGGDLQMFPGWVESTPMEIETALYDFYGAFLSIRRLPIPTIAAVNGSAIGAGACLALACDMRFAAESASIGFTFIRLGINPGMGAEYLLYRLVGPAKTKELLMTGDILSAEDAGAVGLVNRVIPDARFKETVMGIARRIAGMPGLPLKVIKENTDGAHRGSLSDTLHKEAVYQGITFQEANFQEGIQAMLEKRAPEFKD